jgi:hypothetical protein
MRDDAVIFAAILGALVLGVVYVRNKIAGAAGAVVDAANSGLSSAAGAVATIDPHNDPQWGWLPQGTAAPVQSATPDLTYGGAGGALSYGGVGYTDPANYVGTGTPGGGT